MKKIERPNVQGIKRQKAALVRTAFSILFETRLQSN